MKRLTPREVMEKIKEDRKLSNRTKDEWLEERNKVDLETKNVKENETEKETLSRLRLRNEYALPLSEQEIDLVSKSQHEDEEEARYWKNAKLREGSPRIFYGPRGGRYYYSRYGNKVYC
ncbi:hypothetical protein [uncultured Prochlorococcus sp.]|uniref:hypothetical protein n=1 Tax=uncultured Prochlorococcus sp. TaxID=159733 RepID=UPI00258F42F0|nr:hypothetical protein [uncultured Prochlorococcus sp.]